MNELCGDQKFISYASRVFHTAEQFCARFGQRYLKSSNLFIREFFLPEMDLAIIGLNTALLTGGGLSDDVKDDDKLAFPERSIVESLKRVPEGADVMVMGHHPLTVLNETSRDYLKPLFMKEVDLYLSGHLHKATPEKVTAPQGSCDRPPSSGPV